ncbi:O-antigen ligase family protein [Patescibacteria group bacterium]|nr:O-antigen ligase family protein [Patescibacteria group bacterium]MBU4057370.1 O-antigen ligase family protein [Patescibacteria group bacterium]MBU4115763.1 O-antigen ligase family protein [Patescibacteria group bacterium]
MSLNKILKYIVNTGIFLVPFIPLVVTSSLFFPFISGKNFLFRIIVEIIFGAWAILAIKNKEYRPKSSWILWGVIAFVGIIGVANLFGVNPMKSLWSNFERMEGWVTLIHLLAYFLVISAVFNTQKLWNRFFNTSIFVSVLIGSYGVLQLLGKVAINQGGVRLDATFGNATYLAVYMLFHIFLTSMLALRRFNERYEKGGKIFSFKWLDVFYCFSILVQLFILYHTATRGAILGLIFGWIIALLLFVLFDKKEGIFRKISLWKLTGIAILIIGFFLMKDASFVKKSMVLSRFSSITYEEATTARFPVWNMALKGFEERPILGWGQENFNYVFNKNYEPKMYNQEQWFDRAHNIVMDWLVAGGILGLLSYLSLFFLGIFYLWRKKENKNSNEISKNNFSLPDKAILTGLFVGYFFSNLFVFDNIVSYILFFSILSFIYVFSSSGRKKQDKPINIHNDWLKNTAVVLVVILTIGSIYFFNVNGILTGKSLINALKNRGNLELSLENFNKAFSYGYLGKSEAREQIVQISSSLADVNMDLDMKQKFFDLASSEMTKQIQEDPENARYEVFLGTFFNRYRLYDNATIHFERALELSPNKQSTMFELGASYLNKGEKEKALDLFKKAFESDESYLDARKIYAVGAIYNRKDKLVEDLLIPEFGTILVPDDFIIKAYFDTNQFDKVIQIEKEGLKKDPTNIQGRLYLISSYLKQGRKTEAIKEVKEAIKAIPSFEKQGEQIIKEIESGLYN